MNHEAGRAKNYDFSFAIGRELSAFFKSKDTTKPTCDYEGLFPGIMLGTNIELDPGSC